MRRLRHRLLQRLIAVLLVAGVGASVVPIATAATHRGAHGLDARALTAARSASRLAPTREAAADAFVSTYVRVSGQAGVERSLYRLLLDASIGDVPLPAPPEAVASAAPVGAPTPSSGGAAILPAAPRPVARLVASVRAAEPAQSAQPEQAAGAASARAP